MTDKKMIGECVARALPVLGARKVGEILELAPGTVPSLIAGIAHRGSYAQAQLNLERLEDAVRVAGGRAA